MEFILTHPDSGFKNIVVLFDGVPYEADSNHPWWDEIINLVLDDDPRVLDLFPIRPVQQPSEIIAEEVCLCQNNRLLLDERCDDPDCDWCYPPGAVQSSYAPAKAATTPLERRMEELCDELEKTLEEREELERRHDQLAEGNETLSRGLDACEEICNVWEDRALFLEAAVQNYAEHAWADIRQGLEAL